MIDPEMLSMLRCPSSGAALELASENIVASVNRAIEQGQARDVADQMVDQTIEAGLMVAGSDRVYPVRGGIPTLVPNEAIVLTTVQD